MYKWRDLSQGTGDVVAALGIASAGGQVGGLERHVCVLASFMTA